VQERNDGSTNGTIVGSELVSSELVVSEPMAEGDTSADSSTIGTIVAGAKQRRDLLESKKLFRPAAKINGIMPRGSDGLKLKVPKRKDFGEQGAAGDAAHEAAMKEFSVNEFGRSHLQDTTLDNAMSRVGIFGHWLERNKYGVYVEWQVKEGVAGKSRCMVAVDCDGSPRVPSYVAMMECTPSPCMRMAGRDGQRLIVGCWLCRCACHGHR